MSTLTACMIVRKYGLPTSFVGIARRSGYELPLAIAALDVAGHREDAAAAVHLATMGAPDDYVRARAATWNARLRDALPDECV